MRRAIRYQKSGHCPKGCICYELEAWAKQAEIQGHVIQETLKRRETCARFIARLIPECINDGQEALSPMQNSFGRSLASDTKLVEDSDGNWKCQNCQELWDFETNVPQDHKFYYCPNCGAKICQYIAFKEE
ncbi:hypothetical protein [Aminobacterium colombiense]|jgi:formamidopyrimidine-DNA glycosylase|uniref:hypothetical protein n=1 Tax=Aminobacterium colombiense TaxID=81468 RepID=UPI002598E9BD|nr:hypothetical protein [uncultured Aminobacterium sp.]